MLGTSIKKAYEELANWNPECQNNAYYPGFRNQVVIIVDDGSVFIYKNAFLVHLSNDYLGAIAEHYEPMVFHKNDLIFYEEQEKIIDKIRQTKERYIQRTDPKKEDYE